MKQETLAQEIAKACHLQEKQVSAVIGMLDEQNTIPFIARYRKELTGGLDEVAIHEIDEKWRYAQNLEARKQEVLRLIEEQGALTDALRTQITGAKKLQDVEDLYRPYKKKRRTKATAAKEKGIEPLADFMLSSTGKDPAVEAENYRSKDQGVESAEAALTGAEDILAERVSDDATTRKWIRALTERKGKLRATARDKSADPKGVYEMYYDYTEPLERLVSHRILALNRGEKEKVLSVAIEAPEDEIIHKLCTKWIKTAQTSAAPYIEKAITDGYKRLIAPSIAREIRKSLTEEAEEQAIHIFSENLRHLLLQPPLRGKVVLGVDPAYRTGCKLAVIDETGKMLATSVIYPTPPQNKVAQAHDHVMSLIKQYGVEMIAIGNGTASRETEQFIADVLKAAEGDIYYIIVNEAGASVYSASAVAREEFPELQVEERSAISIGRRLQDPLSELVKIDPESVGVGQYQHDVAQKRLGESLSFVVETAVNKVGVNVNTASVSLLQHVAGLSKTTAKNVVHKRVSEGKFEARSQLKDIPRLGAKTFEQCIGFLRIIDSTQPLDRTAIHPERYAETIQLLEELSFTPADIGTDALQDQLAELPLTETAERLRIGKPTLEDIVEALKHPGRDLREALPKPLLKTDVMQLEDLREGMPLQGTVRNVVDFGAFVDVGVKQDGLVHISKLSSQFVRHPLDVVHVGQIVDVWVQEVDAERGRIALSMLQPSEAVTHA